MQAGPLRHLITFNELNVELDSDGAQVESWIPAFGGLRISAEITALSGKELIAAQAVQSQVKARIKIRYRPGIVASMRVLHRLAIYNVEGIIPDPDSGFEFVTLLCSTGVNEG
jgi:SPP1 family predicted phage head-tail adaptor